MSSFKLDSTGDLEVVDNKISLTSGADGVKQHLQERFQLFLSEWFLDTTLGVPYYRDILIKNPSFAVVQEILKTTALDTPGVIELTRFDFEFDSSTRTADLDFEVVSTQGLIDFTQVIGV